MIRYELTTAPSTEPVTISDLQANEFLKSLDLTDAVNIALINAFITTARQLAEKYLNRAIISQTWKASFDCFPCVVDFRLGNLVSVSSVKTVNEDSTETTQAAGSYSYTVGDGARLWLRDNYSWNTTTRALDVLRIAFLCGWANAAAVPQAIRTAIMITVAYLWTNRESINESGLPPEARNILHPYKIMEL